MAARLDAVDTRSLHDTELCAWWGDPCGLPVLAQDLCHYHYNHAANTNQRTPRFEVVRSLTHHVLSAVDDAAKLATCSVCGPDSPFRLTSSTRRGVRHRRRTCTGAQAASQRRIDTGWGPEEYDLALIAQGNRCAICDLSPEGRGRHGVLQADHCHATRGRRQLLCGQCNHLLGLAGDAPETLRRAAAYLARHAEDLPPAPSADSPTTCTVFAAYETEGA